MDTPGYDPVSATGQVAGGANVLCFTTGRGSAYGCKPTPSIKLATNTPIYERMIDDMDINCGDVLDGVSIEDKGQEIFAKVLEVASGDALQVRGARLRRHGIRALADRRDDVGKASPPSKPCHPRRPKGREGDPGFVPKGAGRRERPAAPGSPSRPAAPAAGDEW